ncbi:MAG: molybdopterin-dependent oxidoreductase [Deltaproteobacteria bacterium]|nr:molybdopterin-dependent oxidoreductase [Deltaproteobacteria bacterium]
MELSRRNFLRGAGAAAVSLTLANLEFASVLSGEAAAQTAGPVSLPGLPNYRGWEDVFRQKWTWDKITKGTHTRTNCIAACSWNLYVKDGIVWREEQNTIYQPSHPTVPDMNPRGCQKGGCYSQLNYEPSRLKYPMRRVGERGSGKWERMDWDATLTQVADTLLDVATTDGPDCVVYDHGTTNIDFGTSTAAEMRFFGLLGATVMDSWAGVGDLPMGAIQTWGHFNADGTSDDWFNSDYILIWIANPVYTRIPDVHFMWEARYRGAKVVSIAPDYNPSTVHADLWLNLRMGTDAALGLAMAQVIISENLFKTDYVREQTDLPFLVRDDNKQYLRQSDVQSGGKDDIFYFWDETTKQIAEAPGSQGHKTQEIRLGAVTPALHGRFQAKLADGRTVAVRPLLEGLTDHLQQYTPEKAAQITGVNAEMIRRVAREAAKAKAAMIFASWGACKHYHSDLAQRAMCLLMALTGNQGKRGGGIRIGAWYSVDALNQISNEVEIPFYAKWLMQMFPPKTRDFENFMRKHSWERPFTPTMTFLYVHGGMNEVVDRKDFGDPTLPRGVAEYVKEAMDKKWLRVSPPPERPPRVYFYTGVNPLRRWPVPQLARKHLWPKLKMIVNVNVRMSSSGLQSDILLPAASYYEKIGLKYPQSLVPYVVFGDQAVQPMEESKSEYEIFAMLAQKMQDRARARGLKPFKDHYGIERDYANFWEKYRLDGMMEVGNEEAAMDHLVQNSSVTNGFTWKDAKERGALPIQSYGRYGPHNSICSDFKPGDTVWPQQWFTEKKEPWPTLTGRQQFLLDHAWYVEMKEALPVHKEPPLAGGNYPLRLTGGHTRWSIHAIWRDQRHLLRLQRGQPVMYMNIDDAKKRGLNDHDYVRVFNDVGSFHIHVKPTPSLQPGQVVIYHAWENHQFKDWIQSQEAVPSPWKPLHVAGGYGHIHYRMFYAAPSHSPRGATVEVVKA